MHLKRLYAKWRPLCLGLNVLRAPKSCLYTTDRWGMLLVAGAAIVHWRERHDGCSCNHRAVFPQWSLCPLIHGGHGGPLGVRDLWISHMDVRLLSGLQWLGGMGRVPGWWSRRGPLYGLPYTISLSLLHTMCAMLTHWGMNNMTTSVRDNFK